MSTDLRVSRLTSRKDRLEADLAMIRQQRREIQMDAQQRGADTLSPSEDAEFRELSSQINMLDGELRQVADRLSELKPAAGTSTEGAIAVRRASSGLSVNEPGTYGRGARASYFQDLARVRLGQDDDGSAIDRLRRHAQDVTDGTEYRDLNRTDGNGGYAVPPAWLMNEFVTLARAGRAYANIVNGQPMPSGTDSINIPKVATGTATAVQNGDNTGVQETDLTDTFINAPVRTIAGQQDVAVQLLDQSPVSFDQIIFRDLTADFATKLDLQVISGSGSSGQVTGVRATSGITTIAYTTGAPTVAGIYSKIADAVQRVHTTRFMPPTVIVMHPRRWAWFLAASDSAGRPLVVPQAGNPQNAVATLGAVAAEQVVGQMHGLPVVTDPSMPTTLGAGTNEDVIHVVRASDLLLYESGIRSRVMPEVGSGTLTVRLQIYGYVAFSAARYPASVVELGGTGMTQPVF